MADAIRWALIVVMLVTVAAILAACGGPPAPPSQLKNPPSWCLSGPQKLPQLSPGENLIEKHASLRRQYSIEASKTRCLQRYVRTIRS
jgi:hypothetical protein